MPSERDPLLGETKEPELTQGGGVQSPQPPVTPGAGTAPPSSANNSPTSTTTAELKAVEEGQNQNVGDAASTDESRGEGSPGTGGGSGQGTTNEATEGDSNANEVQTFFAKACEGPKKLLLIVNKNRLSILLLLISNLYSFFFAQKMSGLPWYDWILSRGLLDFVALRSICKVDDTNSVAHKNSDEIKKNTVGIQAVDAKVEASNTEVNTKLDVLIALFQKMEMEKTLEKSDVTGFTGEEAGAGAGAEGESSPRARPAIVDDEHGDESLAGAAASSRID